MNDSQKLIELYNSAWDSSFSSFPGGQPLPEYDLYKSNLSLVYGDDVLPYSNSCYEFSTKNKTELENLITETMKGCDGADSVEYDTYMGITKVYYQYKDGLLDGRIDVLSSLDVLTHQLTYEKGQPIEYIKFYGSGQKLVETKIDTAKMFVRWIEYYEDGAIKNSGENHFRLIYNWQEDLDRFYDVQN